MVESFKALKSKAQKSVTKDAEWDTDLYATCHMKDNWPKSPTLKSLLPNYLRSLMAMSEASLWPTPTIKAVLTGCAAWVWFCVAFDRAWLDGLGRGPVSI